MSTPQAFTSTWRLECRGVGLRRGARAVLDEVNLSLAPGECVSIIGPNGAGKTSLLLVLLGLLPPTQGQVRLDGRSLHALPSRVRGRFAAYVPQTVDHIPAFRVYDVVAAGRFPHVAPLRPLGAADEAAVAAALEQCGLTDLAERPINEVSGGERQKTLIAAAFAQDAQVLFLDEPTNALDPGYHAALIQMIRAWLARGRTLVLVSHDLHLPAVLGGRVIALRDGRIVEDAAAESVLRPETLASLFDAPFAAVALPHGSRLLVPDLGPPA